MDYKIAHPEIADLTEYDKLLYVVSVGYYHVKKTETCARPNGRSDYHLYYVLSGKSRYCIDGVEKTGSAGDIIFYDYDSPQSYSHLAGHDTQIYWVHFNGSFAGTLLRELGFAGSACLHTEENLSVYFEEILRALTYHNTFYLKTATQNLNALLLAIARNSAPNAKKADTQMDYILSLMHSGENNGMTLDAYAEICHLSRSRFIRRFTQYTGTTPMHYKNNLLIQNAKWYLLYTTLSVGEIAAILNVDNIYYFSTLFKKWTGLSPTAFRAARLNSPEPLV